MTRLISISGVSDTADAVTKILYKLLHGVPGTRWRNITDVSDGADSALALSETMQELSEMVSTVSQTPLMLDSMGVWNTADISLVIPEHRWFVKLQISGVSATAYTKKTRLIQIMDCERDTITKENVSFVH